VNNLITRTITGAIFVVAVLGSAFMNSWIFASVFAIFMIVGMIEFYRLCEKINIHPPLIPGILIGVSIYVFTLIHEMSNINIDYKIVFISIFGLSMLLFFLELFRKSTTPLQNIAASILGAFYVSIPFSLIIALGTKQLPNLKFAYLPVFFFIIIWMYDTSAYLVGIKFGKKRICERISPKKSWEGAIGGLFFTLLLAIILSFYFPFLSTIEWIGFATIIVIFGTLGDFAESMLKRNANIKDSGNFFPGHGGILDRFDSVLLSIPFVYLYLMIIEII